MLEKQFLPQNNFNFTVVFSKLNLFKFAFLLGDSEVVDNRSNNDRKRVGIIKYLKRNENEKVSKVSNPTGTWSVIKLEQD